MSLTSAVRTLPLPQRRSVREHSLWSTPVIQRGMLALLLVLGIYLRLAGLHDVRQRSPDEHIYAAMSNHMREHGITGLREDAARSLHDPSLKDLPRPSRTAYLWLVDMTMKLTGDTSASAGIYLSCFASIACLAVVALIGCEFFSPAVACFGLLFYAISPEERVFAQRTWQESVIELVALLQLYLAARISRGERAWYWFAIFAALGGIALGLKEVSFASFLVCSIWVLFTLFRSGDKVSLLVFGSSCFLAVSLAVITLAAALGGLHQLIELTSSNMMAQGGNAYSQQFENGPPYRLLLTLLAVSPVAALFAVLGMCLSWKKDHTERGLVKAEPVAAWLTVFTMVFLCAAAFIPHRLNLRFICMIFGPLYLLAGLGLSWTVYAVRDRLHGLETHLFTGAAVVVLALGAAIDLITFQQNLSVPAVNDLSAGKLLRVLDPIGPILPMKSDIAPDTVEAAEHLEAKEPSIRHRLDLAIAYEETGRFHDSIVTARTVLESEPGSAEAYNDIAAASAAEEHWDESIEAANNALRLNPTYQLAKNNLHWAERQKAIALANPSGL